MVCNKMSHKHFKRFVLFFVFALLFCDMGISEASYAPGVDSINSVTGPFTFTGSGQSCVGTTCTFNGGGGGGSPGGITPQLQYNNAGALGGLTTDTLASFAAHNTISNGLAYDPRDAAYGAICAGYNTFLGDGTTTSYTYTIPFTGSSSTDNSSFMVWYEPTNGLGSATILSTSQFSVTGVNSGAGGTITLNSAVPAGQVLLIAHDDSAGLSAASAASASSGGYVRVPDGCTIYGSQANGTVLAEGAQLIGQSFTPNYGYQGQGTKPIMRVIAPSGSPPRYGINISGKSQQFFEGFEITTNVPGYNSLGFLAVPVLIGANTSAGAGGGQSPGIVAQYMTFNSGSVGFGAPIGGSSAYIFAVLRFNNFTANNAGVYGPLSDMQAIGNNFSSNGAFGAFGSAGGMVIGPQEGAPGPAGASRIDYNRFEWGSEGIVVKSGGLINMEGNQFDENSYCGLDLSTQWSAVNITGGWFRGNGLSGSTSVVAGRDAHICFNSTTSSSGLHVSNVNFYTNYGLGDTAPLGSPNATTPPYVLDFNTAGANNEDVEISGGDMQFVAGVNGASVSDIAIFRNGRPNNFKLDTVGPAKQGGLINGAMTSQVRGLAPTTASTYTAYGDEATYYVYYTANTLYPYLTNADLGGGLTNYTVPFGYDCDVVDQKIFPNSNPSNSGNPLVSWLPSIADPTYGAGYYAAHAAVTQQCRVAGLTWMTIPQSYKVLGQSSGCAQTGTWTNDTRYGGSIGVTSSTNGSSLACSITTTGSPIYAWFQLSENDGGAFTYSVDGGPTTSVATNGGNAFSYPVGTHHTVGAVRLPVFSGSHTVTFNVTSATGSGNNVYIEGIGTPPNKSYLGGTPTVYYGGQLPWYNNTGYTAAIAAFNTAEMTDAQQLAADGLAVSFVNVQNYVDPVADMTNANPSVPNATGQTHLKEAFEGAMQFVPNPKLDSVDPRNFGAACNANYFINTYQSVDNHVTTTAGSNVISVANYTFKAGTATQTGGGDVGKRISIFNGTDVGPSTYIASVDTGANTATLDPSWAATVSSTGAFAVMSGYPTNPADPSTAADDTNYIIAAANAAVASGKKVALPTNCAVHSMTLPNGTLLEGSMGGVDYSSATPNVIPTTTLYVSANGFGEDPHTGINIAGSKNVRLKDFQVMCPTFPYLSYPGMTLAGIGGESATSLAPESPVLDHISHFLCPVEFGVPFAMNVPVAFTASISGNTMTVSAITSTNLITKYGLVSPTTADWLATGRKVTGTGVPANTLITQSPPGGGVGTYTLSTSSTVSSEAMTSPAISVYLSGASRFNQFSNGGIDFNGDFSDFVDVGSVFTGGFTKCMYIGPSTGGSTGNSANRFSLERFEECGEGAVVLEDTYNDQFNGVQWQFNSGYAVQTVGTVGSIQVTGGMMEGNGTSSTQAPNSSHINFSGAGSGFSVVGVNFDWPNYASGGNTKYIFSTSSGSSYDYVSLEGGWAKNGGNLGVTNWAGNTPAHYKQSAPGLPIIDTTQTTISIGTTGNIGIGATASANSVLSVVGLGTTAPVGTSATGYLCIDSSNNVYRKASCP